MPGLLTETDHIGVAVPDLELAVALYVDGLGLRLLQIEDVPGHHVREALLAPPAGPAVQLLAATSRTSPVARFVARTGGGLHHLAYRVRALEPVLAQLAAADPPVHPLPPGVTGGGGGSRVAFLPPQALAGVLVELVEGSSWERLRAPRPGER